MVNKQNWRIPMNNPSIDEDGTVILPLEIQEQINNLKEGESTTFTFEIPLDDDLTT